MSGVVQEPIGRAGSGDPWRGWVPAIVLVGLNLIPLVGVLWLGWDLFSILILYWLESGVVGVVNIFKITRASGSVLVRFPTTIGRGTNIAAQSRGCIAAFFALHYGFFWFIHGVFVFVLPLFVGIASAARGGTTPVFVGGWSIGLEGLVVALVALSAYHALEYWYAYIGRREYERTSPAAQMVKPYARVLVLHLTILFGAALVFASGQTVALVVLLVALKTAIDLGLYAFERSRRARAA